MKAMIKAIGSRLAGLRQDRAESEEAEASGARLDTKPVVLAGLAIIAVTFGGFGTWAAVSQIESAVIASGLVKVLSNRKQVQHLEGGIIDTLEVKNGDVVQEGAVLIRLDETRARATLDIYSNRLAAARAAVARLQAELAERDTIVFPDDLQRLAQVDRDVKAILDSQQQLFRARQATLTGQVTMTRERIGQLHEEIEGRKAQETARTKQVRSLEQQVDGMKELDEKGFARKTDIAALEREMARLEGERGEHVAAMAMAQRGISEAELEIIQYRQTFAERVAEELRERQDEISDLTERVNAARFTLEHTEIRAPATGAVVGLNVFTEGGVVQPGQTLMEIVPDDDMLIVEARVRPVDIDEVSRGQRAWVQFTAFSSRSTPRLEGEVQYIDADIRVDEATQLSYYTVRVAVPDEEIARLGDKAKLQPGMPAEVMIRTGARTPLDYLAKPLQDSIRRAWRES